MSRSAFKAAGKRFRAEGISGRASGMVLSAIKEMEILASKVPGSLSLSQGVPSFPTPRHIIEAVNNALATDESAGKYSPTPGMTALREAAAKKLGQRKGIHVDPEEILITNGAMESIAAALLVILDQGDEVILLSPTFPSFGEQVLLAGGVPVYVPLIEEQGWRLDAAKLEEAITPKTKAILICSPNNPTGGVLSEDAIRSIAEIADDHNLFVVSDETYDFLTYDGVRHHSPVSLPELRTHVIGCFSFSKEYAMTGWRVGYMYAEPGIIDHAIKIHDALSVCTPTISQHAALAAINGPQDCVEEFRREFARRRELACKCLEELSHFFAYQKPQGAYYIFPRFNDPSADSFQYCLRLLHEARVVTAPGGAFGPGGERHIRMSFAATRERIEECFIRIKALLDERS